MTKKKIILTLILLVILLASLVYNYTFNSKHRDVVNEEASITLSSKELFSHFQNNEALATANFMDKVVEVKGELTSIEDGMVVLDHQIQISFDIEGMPKVEGKTSLTIKGRCVGYDELLEMVKIDQATIINSN
jgi:cell division protein YceG involved in septum cleavage